VSSSYLEIVKKAKPNKRAGEARAARPESPKKPTTTNTTETTKAGNTPARPGKVTLRHKPPNYTPLTVSEALAEINRWGSGAGKNAELYRRGELSEERAVEYATCAILHRRGESFEVWRHHAPAVRKAISLCIHELEPEKCKVCNGEVRRLIEAPTPGGGI
jgi:hypothetical protein